MVSYCVKLVYILLLTFATMLFCVHYCLFRLTMFIAVRCYISKGVCLIFITQIIKKYFPSLLFFILCHHRTDYVQTAYLLLYAFTLFFLLYFVLYVQCLYSILLVCGLIAETVFLLIFLIYPRGQVKRWTINLLRWQRFSVIIVCCKSTRAVYYITS